LFVTAAHPSIVKEVAETGGVVSTAAFIFIEKLATCEFQSLSVANTVKLYVHVAVEFQLNSHVVVLKLNHAGSAVQPKVYDDIASPFVNVTD